VAIKLIKLADVTIHFSVKLKITLTQPQKGRKYTIPKG
jgi:hypothetical protein